MTDTTQGTEVIDFVMPSLGADMESGAITEWLVAVGDSVDRGDIMAIVETDKADIDIEVWHSGVVAELLVPLGKAVPVGTPLARLTTGTDGMAQSASPAATADEGPAPELAAPTVEADEPAPAEPVSAPVAALQQPAHPTAGAVGAPVAASPLARRLARERDIDLASIEGSGPEGAVIARDLPTIEALSTPQPEPRPEPEPESGSLPAAQRMRRAIGDLMAKAKREIPHYYLTNEIDVETMVTWLEEANRERSVTDRLLPAAMLMKAVAVATAQQPMLNGFWDSGRFRAGDGVHLGVAISLRGGGLVAPAIHDADLQSIDALMVALRDLVERARLGRLRGSEMTDPTITVTNLGDRGVDSVHGVIYPPQVALVGLGRIRRRPTVIGDAIVIRRSVTVTLAADHRATDGLVGARYLNTIDRLLQDPAGLSTDSEPTAPRGGQDGR